MTRSGWHSHDKARSATGDKMSQTETGEVGEARETRDMAHAGGMCPPKTARGQKTRAALLRAAEKVFGEKGYYAASISEITQEAKVAMGTFYLYFKDKEDIFRALVGHMLELVRAHLRKHVANAASQMEAERLGLKAFLSFVSRHKNLYRIVLDSYSVDETIYSSYFQVFADLYSRRLIGWAMGPSLDTSLPLAALQMALRQRRPAPGVLHHSDRGCQYASTSYRRTLTDHGCIASMSRAPKPCPWSC